jgi:hypothetical protein
MDFDFGTLPQSTAVLLASLIGAITTVSVSMLNLRMAWKKELMERANKKPVTKKASRGPILPLLALLIASAFGGFALSYYLGSKGRANSEALEAELRTKIEQLSLSTQRLETVSFNGVDAIAQQARNEERRKRGIEGIVALVLLDKCVARTGDGQSACSEAAAQPVQLCTEIPADASVAAIDLYARPEGDTRPWSESRVVAGNDFGGGRFTTRSTERLISDSTKQVCQELLHWNSDHAINGRIVVHYGSAS